MGGMAVGGRAGQSLGPRRQSGGAGVGAGLPRTARQARAPRRGQRPGGSAEAGGARGGPRRLPRPRPLGGWQTPAGAGLIFPHVALLVHAGPHKMVSLRGVAVTAAGRVSSAERSALRSPAGGSREGRNAWPAALASAPSWLLFRQAVETQKRLQRLRFSVF